MSNITQMPTDNVTLLRAAIMGHVMEHGIAPSFVLLTVDVAQAVFREVETNNAYKGFINVGATPSSPMYVNLGQGPIEIGQIVGNGRVELVTDLSVAKARKAL